MPKILHIPQGQPVDEWFLDELQEFISSIASANFIVSILNPTTVQVVAGVGNAQVSIGIANPAGSAMAWRWNTATVTAAAPGSLIVGDNDVYVTAYATVITTNASPPPRVLDTTPSLGFALMVLPPGTTPSGAGAQALYRKVAQATWDGAAFTAIKQTVGAPGISNTVLAQALLLSGTLAARPAAGSVNQGFYYFAADVYGGTLYQSSASTWQQRTNGLQQSGLGAGVVVDFAGPEANIPPNTCPTDGRALDTTIFAAAYARIGNNWDTFGGLSAPGAGWFRAPDLRGRGTIGKNNMGAGNTGGGVGFTPTPGVVGARIARAGAATLAALIGEEFHTLTSGEMPSHDHGALTGAESSHTHSGTTGAGSAHSHGIGTLIFTGTAGNTGAGTSHTHGTGTLIFTGAGSSTGLNSGDHTHSGTTGTESVDHTHSTTIGMGGGFTAEGGGVGTVGKADSTSSTWTSGGRSAAHTHSFTTGGISANHSHAFLSVGAISGSTAAEAAHTHAYTPAGTLSGATATEAAHTHAFTTGAGSAHLHSIAAAGGGGSHENVFPVAALNKVMTLA